MVAKNKMQKPF